jgi:hypothetical protein
LRATEYVIEEFGASRHCDKREAPSTSLVLVDGSRTAFGKITVRLTTPIRALHQRVAMRLEREPESFILMYQKRDLRDYTTLQDAHPTDASEIEGRALVPDRPRRKSRGVLRLFWRIFTSRTI